MNEDLQAQFDIKYMQMAIALSRRGVGLSAPNPSVGVIIVKNGIVLGRGVTQKGGRPHAERVALDLAGGDAQNSTIYVTLEPCAKRSQADAISCTDTIINAGVSRVVIGACDPSPLAAGQGATRLQAHGIEVVSGVEYEAAKWVNLGHILRVSKNRPLVTLKLAQTKDGFAGTIDHKPFAITGEETRSYVHMMRARSDAIAVGISTILFDDPYLDVRLQGLEDRSPVRVVFDSDLQMPLSSRLVKTARALPLWIIADLDASANKEQNLVAAGAEVMRVKKHDLKAALGLLADRGVSRLMVEGGPILAEAFAKNNLIDELVLFTAPWNAEEGLKAIGASLMHLMSNCNFDSKPVNKDQLQHYKISY